MRVYLDEYDYFDYLLVIPEELLLLTYPGLSKGPTTSDPFRPTYFLAYTTYY